MSVGIDMIPNRAASSCSASVSTLANTTPSWVSEAASKMGANIRHGPHQLAQKSTNTTSFDVTVSSKLLLSSATVATVVLLMQDLPSMFTHYTPWGIPDGRRRRRTAAAGPGV